MSHLTGVRFPDEPVTRTCPACRRTISALVEHPAAACPATRDQFRAAQAALVSIGAAVSQIGNQIVTAFRPFLEAAAKVQAAMALPSPRPDQEPWHHTYRADLDPWQQRVMDAAMSAERGSRIEVRRRGRKS